MSFTFDYINRYYSDLMSENERSAYDTWFGKRLINICEKNYPENSPLRDVILENYLKDVKVSDDPEVLKLLDDGIDTFMERVSENILIEHPNIYINKCPKCNETARTREAKQCPRCYHRWK